MAKTFFVDDGYQNIFIYQPTVHTIELKKDKGTAYTSKLKPLHTTFLHSIKLSGYRIGIKFYKDPLAVEQNIYTNNIVHAHTVYDLDAWQRNAVNNFKF